MLSRISCFNKTLYRKNLTRYWPLWVMASFGGALVPLVLFMELNRYNGREMIAPLEMTEMYYNVVTYGVPLISLFYSILCAIAVWNYHCNSRSVGLMHTLPITRKGLFVTNFLSGMTMMAIPYLVTGGLTVLISIFFGFFEPVGILVTIACVIAESFFYFATATAVAFITANVFAMPVLYFIFHFLAVIADFMVSTFAQGFIFGLTDTYNGVVEWLSPTVYLMSHVRVDSASHHEFTAEGTRTYILDAVWLENWHLIVIYAAVGVLCTIFAWLLYRRRRSEAAGDVVAVGWMKPVFRWGVTACCALLGGQALYLMFLQDEDYRVGPMVICMVVAGTIGYYAARMLLAKSLRVFKGSWKGIATLAVLSAALCLSLEADLLNIERRVPAIDSIDTVQLYMANNTYYFDADEEAELLEEVRTLHAAIAADADYIENFSYERYETEKYSGDYNSNVSRYNTFEIRYTLKSGIEMRRYYRIPIVRQRTEQQGTYDQLVTALVNSEAMKTKRLHFGDPDFTLSSGYLWATNSGSYDFSTREAKLIHDAVYADLKAGNWGDHDFFERNDAYYYDMNLEFNFARRDDRADYTRYDYININLYPGMINTIRCLLDMGVITEADLKTNIELYPDRYDYNYQVWGEKYGELTSFPDYGLSSSMGIIGGADGPTAVVVSGF